MRAIAIFGPSATRGDLAPFQRAHFGVALTQAASPQPDADAALIFGGDGTVHRHLAKVVEHRLPLLVVPGGSGNDFARALGLKSPSDAVAAWEQFCAGRGNVREIDLGVITPLQSVGAQSQPTPASTYFCCIGGVGLDSETNRRANRLPPWFRAHGGYIAAALREIATWKPMLMTVRLREATGEWKSRVSESATFAAFANATSYGDGMKMAPRAKLNDGLLDVCFVRRISRRKILTFFPTVFFGAHLRLPEVEYFQVPALRLETERPMDVYADGEYVCKTPVEVNLIPRGLRAIVRRVD